MPKEVKTIQLQDRKGATVVLNTDDVENIKAYKKKGFKEQEKAPEVAEHLKPLDEKKSEEPVSEQPAEGE